LANFGWVTGRLSFRRWWQPPARYEDRPADRRVTFLELFFDLVFVVLVSQLAHHLAANPTWEGVGWFAFLFYAVWTSWINGTFYYDLHGTNDISVRIFTFAQMLTVAVMAVFAGDVPGAGAGGFAIAYGFNSLLLAIIWFRTGLHDPSHRLASNPYSAAYLLGGAIFIASAAVSEPSKYWMWGLALVIESSGYVVSTHRWQPPESQQGEATIAATASLIERMGLFVIIVLGEVIVGAINGMADVRPLHLDGVVIGLLGVLVAIGLWWIYFDLVSHNTPVSRLTQLWLYLHFPLLVAIASGGAGVLNTVENSSAPLPDSVRWLLVGSLSTAVLSVTALTLTLEARARYPEVYRMAGWTLLVSAALMLAVGTTAWGAKATLGALVMLLLAPVTVGIVVWLRHTDPESVPAVG
jgi:low temperature requirement protein LtrA